jgi:DivIVA domain-containing protein
MTDAVQQGGLEPDHFSRYVVRTFRQTLRGYSTVEVDAHLRQVRGWFTLAGFDRLVADHRQEILGSALQEAEATVAQAQRESEAMLDKARREAEAIREDAERRAQAATAAMEERLAALKTLALAILEEIDAQS